VVLAPRKLKPDLIDEDNPEWTDEDFARSKPFSELPQRLQAKLRKSRGPQKAPTKERITIRLSRDVVGAFRSSGPGWQSRLDGALRTWLRHHDPHEVRP
jgi:uncharacterized protein (DUF4415 family)